MCEQRVRRSSYSTWLMDMLCKVGIQIRKFVLIALWSRNCKQERHFCLVLKLILLLVDVYLFLDKTSQKYVEYWLTRQHDILTNLSYLSIKLVAPYTDGDFPSSATVNIVLPLSEYYLVRSWWQQCMWKGSNHHAAYAVCSHRRDIAWSPLCATNLLKKLNWICCPECNNLKIESKS
jgi:hypothetical protein